MPTVVPTHNWNLPDPPEPEAAALARELGLSAAAGGLLLRRGFDSADAVRDFLAASPSGLHQPDTLPDIEPATDRIIAALENGERICIHGDYDVDGVTATVLLLDVLRRLGGDVVYYLPHREEEGYGLSLSGIDFCREQDATLLVTVDCGSTDCASVTAARDAGIDVVITDHHEVKPELPDALAHVNPKRPGSTYPWPELAGVGVAFKLAWRLLSRLERPKEELTGLLDLVGLGTIADVVPLRDENRILARLGLAGIGTTRRPGLQALREVAGIPRGAVTPYHVGFVLAPRLNAAGRVDHARHAVDLLLAENPEQAAALARVLHEQNNARRQVERRVVTQALDEVERRGLHRRRVIVVGRVGWPAGVLGLAASRLAERFHRPSVVVSFDDEPGRGSGRSVNGFDLYAALEAASDHLAGFGGHRHAAGVKVERDRLADFSAAVNRHADTLPEDVFRPSIDVDAVIGLEDIDGPLVDLLQGLEPFGAENRAPLFAALGVEVTGWPRLIGRNREHLTFRVRSGGSEFDAVAWKRGPELPNLEPGEPGSLDLCFTVERHTWQNRTTTRLNVRDLRSRDAGPAV